MARNLLFLLLIPFALFAGELKFVEGSINAHTEVFGDSHIDQGTKNINTYLTMDKSIESINGSITINSADLISQNKDRDAHMHEALETIKHPQIKYMIKHISKGENGYTLNGIFTLHGVSKNLKVNADIKKDENGIVNLNSKFTIKSSAYDIKPITLFFLTVRDEIDIDVALNLKGE